MKGELIKAIKERHSVRSYTEKAIPEDIKQKLIAEVAACNAEGGYNIQLITDEPEAFTGFLAHYGKFLNVRNYIALVGKDSYDLDEKLGFLGERLVIFAQSLGLNTCWVALTFSRKKAKINISGGERLVCVISLGYGLTPGTPHKNRPIEKLCDGLDGAPEWYKTGVECAMNAPTAVNQQKFFISRNGNAVNIVATGGGRMGRVDLGIVKYNFSVGAGDNFVWEE